MNDPDPREMPQAPVANLDESLERLKERALKRVRGSGPSGLGGWLIFVAIGLIVSPVFLFAVSVRTFMPIFRNGTWSTITTPNSASYHPLLASLIVFEMVVNVCTILAGLWLIYLFFKRAKIFPRVFVWFTVLNLAFMLLDAVLGSLVIRDQPIFDSGTISGLTRSIIVAAVWVSYMLNSQRVKNTFVVIPRSSKQASAEIFR
jgi:hypothetical protein